MAPVADLGTAVLTGITAAFVTLLSALPVLLGAVVLLALGWFVSGIVGRVVVRVLRAARLETASERAGVNSVLRRAHVQADIPSIVGGFVTWYARLIFVLMAADAVHLTAISTIVNAALAFIPNLLVAVVMLAAFGWLAGFARNASLGALEGAGVANARAISVLVYAATFGFGVIAAATQLGVATTLVEIFFAGLVGALALAFGLAFGLGGRDEAAALWHGLRPQTVVAKSGAPAVTTAGAPTTSIERPANGETVHEEATLSN